MIFSVVSSNLHISSLIDSFNPNSMDLKQFQTSERNEVGLILYERFKWAEADFHC